MRILLITATYPPSVNGVAVTVSNLKETLKRSGHEVRVLAPNIDIKNNDPEIFYYPSIPNPLVKDYPVPLFPGVKSIYKLVTSFKPDIVHVHHPFHVGYFAKIIADRYKVPLVFTYHTRYDLYAEEYVEFLPKKVKNLFIKLNVNDLCKSADVVISPSEYLKKLLERKFKFRNVVTLPSPVPVMEKTKLSKNKIRKVLGIPHEKKVLLTVSRLGREKNVKALIDSMKYLSSDYLLLIVGGGPDERKLKDYVSEKGLDKNIVFAGKIPHQKINRYYQSSDIFCYASKTETQGLVFLEALSFGLPIVAIDSHAAKEWVGKSVGVIVKNKPQLFSEAVKKMDEERIKRYSASAIKLSKLHTQDKIVKRLLEIYRTAIINKNDQKDNT